MVAEIPTTERNRTKKKNVLKDSEFRFDFYDQQEYKVEDLLIKKKNIKPFNKNEDLMQLQLLSIDYHYKPQWLFKTSYFDLKEIEEQERLAKKRQEEQEEEEQYKGFNGDDEFDIINQIDEYTLLGATPIRNTQMEVMDTQYERNQNINDDGPNDIIYYQNNQGTQITSQYEHTQSNPNSKNQAKKIFLTLIQNLEQNVRKMKIQELKQRLWSNLSDTLDNQQDISYVELINKLELQKSEQASIQSCLVAVLHLCNENNLQLYNNDLDNFMIKRNIINNQTSQMSDP